MTFLKALKEVRHGKNGGKGPEGVDGTWRKHAGKLGNSCDFRGVYSETRGLIVDVWG